MTLQELYNELPNRNKQADQTPRQKFISRLADVTGAKEKTAMCWICGTRTPSASARKLLAEHFGRPEEELFPQPQKTKNKDKEQ